MKATDKTMKAMMGLLYGSLTDGGNGAVEQNERERFICWCLPGIPIDPEELRFNIRGFTGDGNTPAEIAEDVMLLKGQASRFARLVDFTPDATSVFDEQQQMAAFERGENSLASLYDRVLIHSMVAKSELTQEEKEEIERINNSLFPWKEVEDQETGETDLIPTESPLYKAYKRYKASYETAAETYNRALANSQNPDTPEEALEWTFNGEIYKSRIDAALAEWKSAGRKGEVEKAQAFISAVTERDLNLWKEGLKNRFRGGRFSDSLNQPFMITQMVPGNFFSNGAGWSKFTFSHKQVDHFESHKTTQWDAQASLAWKLSFSADGSGSTTANNTVDNTDEFEFSCSLAQVPLVRPWFDPTFLESRAWKFGPNEIDLTKLSDGGNPPQGLMVAYPVSVIFARDLHINFKELHDETSELNKTLKAGGKVGWGLFNLSGSYSRDSQTKQVQSILNENGVTVSGLQILGFRCRLLKKSPDPMPGIENWV